VEFWNVADYESDGVMVGEKGWETATP
jgi:hypothetical protein